MSTNGKVKFYSDARGFGFIAPDDGGADVFVHATQLTRVGYSGLAEGQLIRYEIGTNDRSNKPMAIRLELLEPIISPAATPRAFHAAMDDLDAATAHMELARQTFMRR